jgi:hypothetical protein
MLHEQEPAILKVKVRKHFEKMCTKHSLYEYKLSISSLKIWNENVSRNWKFLNADMTLQGENSTLSFMWQNVVKMQAY